MKYSALVLFFISNLAFAENIFWCTPHNRLKRIEGVIVRNDNGKNVFATYTTSKKWGAVDERLESFSFSSEEGNWIYKSTSARLTVEVGDRAPKREDIFSGIYKLNNTSFELPVECEFNQN